MKKLILFLVLLSSFVYAQVAEDRLRMMSWNVQNLFDPVHDEGKDDWEYLSFSDPLKKSGCDTIRIEQYRLGCHKIDWTRPKLELKYKQIKKMLDSVGVRPDVLAVVEVENDKVLSELGKILGYKNFVMTTLSDERGVDLALFYNEKPGFKYVSHEDVEIKLSSPTRPILKVVFEFNKAKLDVYVNHWPAAGAPTSQRLTAARALRASVDQSVKSSKTPVYSVAVGDFNVTSDSTPDVFEVFHDPKWSESFYDLDEVARRYVKVGAPGTYYAFWKNQWNLFDRIFLSKNFFDQKTLKIPVNRYQIVTTLSKTVTPKPTEAETAATPPPAALAPIQIPWRYDVNTTRADWAGYSDHYPVLFEIVAGGSD